MSDSRSALPVRLLRLSVAAILVATSLTASALPAPQEAANNEWSQWRGPDQNGVSAATDLPDDWTVDGPGQLWHGDIVGRSTPVAFDGRVCANGRLGEGMEMRETVACWNAATGERLWQRSFNVYNTTVPFTRVGWGSVAGDSETGNLYVLNVDGWFHALDELGRTVWSYRLHEDYGRFSGYGGRTGTPVIDENRVLLPVINGSWAEFTPGRQRFYAFDKHDGRVLWVSNPSEESPKDLNIQAVPVVTEIDGQRLMIVGGADGWIYALQARTGNFVWKFQLSKRGINVSVVEADGVVYAAHSEENLDEGVLGRVVAIDARGQGDITHTNELWRATEIPVGFSSPMLHDGVLHVIDNSANLIAFDAATGRHLWEQNIGNVGKASPVWADGKIYATEVNGNFVILRAGEDGAEVLDTEHIEMPDGRHAEICSSPAVAYGRIYFTTENGIYAIGNDADAPIETWSAERTMPVPDIDAEVTSIKVVPADVVIRAGEPAQFEVHSFDVDGNFIRSRNAVWSLAGLEAEVSEDGTFWADPAIGHQVGRVLAETGGMLSAYARVRVIAAPPTVEDFNDGERPPHWVAAGRWGPMAEFDGENVLTKGPSPSGIHRHVTYTADASTRDVTVQVDLYATQEGRRRADGGVVNGGYTLDLAGNHQRLEIRSWASELLMMERVPFEWDMETWYTVKLRVEPGSNSTMVRAKVWRRDEAEPAEWTLEIEDPRALQSGAPGIYGYSPVNIYYDNYKVTANR
ncbi:MAG: PQQ-binding-like beta-propeller repeat protein [Acidobacteria bacterium]|nr:PQQ-binding-like beta-propeller repeat protein [Acidobacteriota bacterium]